VFPKFWDNQVVLLLFLPDWRFVELTLTICGKYCSILSCLLSHVFLCLPISGPFYFVLTKLLDILVLTRIGSTSLGRSAHLFYINVCAVVIVELVLIWLLNCHDQIKFIKLIPWPLFSQIVRHLSAILINPQLWDRLPMLRRGPSLQIWVNVGILVIFLHKNIGLKNYI
jgi:hypothetical protein